ncbi:Uncharacterized protein APZ42_021764 [Daphnia magna]|uniref:Uncharacterized protein n=1 Tax=Daphnia magna TaxID=35525 RepID=A0A164WD80_9CRUS|nr:Uncharacterized protein APZ42_021764 [Daphnia magna]
MNWWLFEVYKRERSLKGVGMQSMKLIRIQLIGGCLRDAKGNGLGRVLDSSHWSC